MNKSKLQTIIKSVLKVIVPSAIAIALIVSPILHQSLSNNYTTHFSILSSIQMDISEHQLQTPYFISTIFTATKQPNIINKAVSNKTIQQSIKFDNTMNYYGIVKGNGNTATITLKVGNSYQNYTINNSSFNDSISGTPQLITIDKAITATNYKSIKIISVKDFNHKDNTAINEVNKMITEYNKLNS